MKSKKLELYLGIFMDPIPIQCIAQGFMWQSSKNNLKRVEAIANAAICLKTTEYLSESEFLAIQSTLSADVQSTCCVP